MKRLNELANHVSGNILGNAECQVTGAASLNRATCSEITFATSEKHFTEFLTSQAMAAIIPKGLKLDDLVLEQKSFICVDDPEAAFTEIVKLFRPTVSRKRIGVSPQAYVSPTAEISEDVDIHAGVHIADGVKIGCGAVLFPNVTVLENTVIGAHVKIYPNAVLYENTVVGDRAIIHAGAVLGAFGFGYRSNESGHTLSAQLGNVEIESDVEIGANTTIDRGTYEPTRIGQGSKIDNQVMIAHNCQIGDQNLICSQVGIAGSSTTGNRVVMAGQVGVGDHLSVGDEAVLCAQSGIMHHLAGGQVYAGSPAVPVRQNMQSHALIAKLPEMRKKIKLMEKAIQQIELNSSNGSLETAETKPVCQDAA
ncbi:MAG: UDP-3-O-(3-hydroxymyristoyl)glucosamine N-acyltransferase [Mariniblastus sp.]|nr:UDP-3-O-(3-hydroxymyristoyl)glucosamine N-acyltransferase [Mariniblastus sp.]